MRLLLDANLSHRIAVLPRARGFDASQVRDHGLQHADEEAIFDFAAEDGCVLVSEDTDFGEILAYPGREGSVAGPAALRGTHQPRRLRGPAR